MAQKTSIKGVLEIFEHEGVVPAPYYDSKRILTFGIGHTAAAGGIDPAKMPFGMPANVDAAIDLAISTFQEDLVKYERRVNDALKVQVKQHEFDALVSFDFNTGGIYSAILTREINAGNPEAYRHFMGWLKPPEIKKRRTAEMTLFRTGDYEANGNEIAVWKVDSMGNLRGFDRIITGREILERMKDEFEPIPEPSNCPIKETWDRWWKRAA